MEGNRQAAAVRERGSIVPPVPAICHHARNGECGIRSSERGVRSGKDVRPILRSPLHMPISPFRTLNSPLSRSALPLSRPDFATGVNPPVETADITARLVADRLRNADVSGASNRSPKRQRANASPASQPDSLPGNGLRSLLQNRSHSDQTANDLTRFRAATTIRKTRRKAPKAP
jgi:hypothetical protein